MSNLWSVFSLFLYLVLLPVLAGWFLAGQGHLISRVAVGWSYGMIVMMAAFELTTVPLILLHRTLTLSGILWHILLGIWIVGGSLCHRGKSGGEKVLMKRSDRWNSREILLLLILVAVVVLTCAVYVTGMHIDDDDARYVANALAAQETNTMYLYHPNTGEPMKYFMGEVGKEVASPLMMYYAMLSLFTGIHATIMIHTVLPPVLLCLSYLILWILSLEIWPEEREKSLLFLVLLSLIRVWGNTSIYTGETFTLMRIWQGKALVPAVFVPLILLIGMRIWHKSDDRCAVILLLVCNTAACLSSGMGIYLSATLTGICAVVCMVLCKSVKPGLHMLFCCVPNAVYTGIYILVRKVILR